MVETWTHSRTGFWTAKSGWHLAHGMAFQKLWTLSYWKFMNHVKKIVDGRNPTYLKGPIQLLPGIVVKSKKLVPKFTIGVWSGWNLPKDIYPNSGGAFIIFDTVGENPQHIPTCAPISCFETYWSWMSYNRSTVEKELFNKILQRSKWTWYSCHENMRTSDHSCIQNPCLEVIFFPIGH